MKPKEYYTISEFAKLRGVTTETLRHYDRIGLLKPAYIDPDTNYRYYSIYQYEKLGTIKELRQLQLPLDMIQDYFDNRNVKKSVAILDECHKRIMKQKKEIEQLEKNIRGKLKFLEYATNLNEYEKVRVVEIEERAMISSGQEVKDEDEMGYEWAILEQHLNELSPILGSSRIGYSFPYISDERIETIPKVPFIFKISKGAVKKEHMTKLPAGKYLDVYVQGVKNYQKAYELLEQEIKDKKYRVVGNVIVFFPVDITLTDEDNESIVELQVPIEFS